MDKQDKLEAPRNWNRAGDGGTPLGRVEQYIQQHLNEKLTIDKMARQAYMSRSRFTSLFRQKMGKTFNEYLSDCRFEAAKTLLADDSNWPIERISDFVGLGTGRLRSLFHQRLGVSPKQFRESLRKCI